MIGLVHEITELETAKEDIFTYGGSQMMFKDRTRRKCGCGLVGALEVLLYIHRHHEFKLAFLKDAVQGPMKSEEYEKYAEYLQLHGMPIIYPLGVNVFVLAAAMNIIFIQNKVPYRAVWCVSPKNLWADIEGMLRADIPVIMCAGNNFPNILGKKKVNLYRSPDEVNGHVPAKVKSHYLIITGMDENWLRISSWGKCFWMKKSDFAEYMKLGTSLFSTVLKIERKNDGT